MTVFLKILYKVGNVLPRILNSSRIESRNQGRRNDTPGFLCRIETLRFSRRDTFTFNFTESVSLLVLRITGRVLPHFYLQVDEFRRKM